MILHTYPYFSSYSVSANRQCPNTSNRHGLACYFMLKDISKLENDLKMLAKEFNDLTERNLLVSDSFTEIPIPNLYCKKLHCTHTCIMYVYLTLIFCYRQLRLELLDQAIVAYHSGNIGKAKISLNSARSRYLQVIVNGFILLL